MDTLIIRIYTKGGGYSSTREITVNIEDLRGWIEANELKSNETLESFNLESVR